MNDADRYRILREAMLRGIPPDPPIKRFMNDVRALFAADATRYRKVVPLPTQRTIGPTPNKGYSSGHSVVEPSAAQKVGKFVAEIAPGSGEGIAAAEAIKQAGKGNWGQAALAAVGAIPVLGKAKGVARTIDDVAPITLFHGTRGAAFDRFDPSKIGSQTDEGFLGRGFYFGTDPHVASAYPTQLQASVRVRSPLNVSLPAWGADKRKIVRDALGLDAKASADEVNAALSRRGHDGVVLDYSPVGYHHKEVMVLAPEQIADVKQVNNPRRK